MAELHVFQDEGLVDTVVARDPDDAKAVWEEHAGVTYNDEPWAQLPDDKRFTIINEDTGAETSQTCGEWAAERGRGFLCSTEY